MRLPGWMVVGMSAISALVVVIATIWCWLDWPRDTAGRFFELVRDENWEEAGKMLDCDAARRTLDNFRDSERVSSSLTLRIKCRTWLDVVMGRQTFQFEHRDNPCFTVERGHVVDFQMGDQQVFMFYIGIMR